MQIERILARAQANGVDLNAGDLAIIVRAIRRGEAKRGATMADGSDVFFVPCRGRLLAVTIAASPVGERAIEVLPR